MYKEPEIQITDPALLTLAWLIYKFNLYIALWNPNGEYFVPHEVHLLAIGKCNEGDNNVFYNSRAKSLQKLAKGVLGAGGYLI